MFGTPFVGGGKIFYGIGTGNMGADVYKYDEEGEMRDKEPAGAVVCLDTATGKEEWRYPLPQSVHVGLAADAFTVYAGCRDGFLYAIDRKTGKLRLEDGHRHYRDERAGGGGKWRLPGRGLRGFPATRPGVLLEPADRRGTVVVVREEAPRVQLGGARQNSIMCAPLVVTTPTATGSKRTIYIGARLWTSSTRTRRRSRCSSSKT